MRRNEEFSIESFIWKKQFKESCALIHQNSSRKKADFYTVVVLFPYVDLPSQRSYASMHRVGRVTDTHRILRWWDDFPTWNLDARSARRARENQFVTVHFRTMRIERLVALLKSEQHERRARSRAYLSPTNEMFFNDIHSSL